MEYSGWSQFSSGKRSPAMSALNSRSECIMKFLLRTGTASIEEILAEAGSSAPSIRRDLARLESRGLIRRTHGTTATHIGRSLRHREHIQVVTNAINIGMELCNQPGIRTFLTGGTVPWAWSFSLTRNAALNFL